LDRLALFLQNHQRFSFLPKLALTLLQVSILACIVIPAFLISTTYVRGYLDDNGYHVPVAVEIARRHNPYYVDRLSARTAFWFPAAAETFVAVLIVLRKDIDISNLSGFLVFLFFLIAAYGFARIWSSHNNHLLLCVLLTATTPVFLGQTLAFYVDIHLNLLIYLSLYLYCLCIVTKKVQFAYLGLCSAILTASIKYHGLAFVAVLAPAGVYCIMRCRIKRPQKWTLVLLALSVLLTSGWYLRNWLLKGNPVYPLPIPEPVQTLFGWIGNPYQAMDPYNNISPVSKPPHPLIPTTLVDYFYRPDMDDDAFGTGFTLSLVLFLLSLVFSRRIQPPKRQALLFLAVTSGALVIVLPQGYQVPRYVMFIPAVTALSPAILLSIFPARRLTYLLYTLILLWGGAYTYVNLYQDMNEKQSLPGILQNRRSEFPIGITKYDYVDEGNLKIGYLNGRFGFIGLLYDRKMTNKLVQLHYQNYRFDLGPTFERPDDFVAFVRQHHLDVIHIFDPNAPGADILKSNFPGKIKEYKFPP
jgi:hypothetical protein